jgi:hypothetical protein
MTHLLGLSWKMIPFSQHLKSTFALVQARGCGLWLITRPFIYSFHIVHFTFTSMLRFHLSLIQPLTYNFLVCKCGHGLDAFGTHLTHCPFKC